MGAAEEVFSAEELLASLARRGVECVPQDGALSIAVDIGGHMTTLELRWQEPVLVLELEVPILPVMGPAELALAVARLNRPLNVLGFVCDPEGTVWFRCHAELQPGRGLSMDWLGKLFATAIEGGERALMALQTRPTQAVAPAERALEVHPVREAEEWWWLEAGPRSKAQDLEGFLQERDREGWTPFVAVEGNTAVGRAEVEHPHPTLAVVTELVVRDDLELEPGQRLALAETMLDDIVRQLPEPAVSAAVWSGDRDRLLEQVLLRKGLVPWIEKLYVHRSLADVAPAQGPFGWSSLAEVGRERVLEVLGEVLTDDPNRDLGRDPSRELDELVARAGRRFDPESFGLVTLQGEPAGVLMLARFAEWPDKGTVLYMGLRPRLRGQRLGTPLHAFALASLRAMGARTYVDSTDVLNAPMLGVFARSACRALGVRSERWLRAAP